MSDIQPFRTRARNVLAGLLNVALVLTWLIAAGNIVHGAGLLLAGHPDDGLSHAIPAILALPVIPVINYLAFGRLTLWNHLVRAPNRHEA